MTSYGKLETIPDTQLEGSASSIYKELFLLQCRGDTTEIGFNLITEIRLQTDKRKILRTPMLCRRRFERIFRETFRLIYYSC